MFKMLSLALRMREKDLLTDWEVFYSKNDGYFTNYSWYHLMWLAIMIGLCVFFALKFAKKHDKKTDDYVIFGFGLFLVLIETYKQIFYTLDAGHYQWYAFPFQFCSVPMFVAFVAPLIKKESIKEALYKFLAFYGLTAGLAVMLYPDSCFHTHYLTILIHTMCWHVSMVVMGIYLIVSKEYCKSIKNIMREVGPGSITLAAIILIAIISNIVAYKLYFGTDKNVYNDTFFLMYISPYYSCPLPILSTIKEQVPYIVFLLCYIVAFMLGISILWLSVYGIKKLTNALKNIFNKKETKNE